MDDVFNELKREAEYAQKSLNSNLLYEVYGKAKMARYLCVISQEEFMEINHDTIYFINTNQQVFQNLNKTERNLYESISR